MDKKKMRLGMAIELAALLALMFVLFILPNLIHRQLSKPFIICIGAVLILAAMYGEGIRKDEKKKR